MSYFVPIPFICLHVETWEHEKNNDSLKKKIEHLIWSLTMVYFKITFSSSSLLPSSVKENKKKLSN